MGDEQNNIPLQALGLDLFRAVREHLVYLEDHGIEGIDQALLDEARQKAAGPTRRLNPAEELRRVRTDLGECTRCRLCQGRKNIVFGDGDPLARIMFVGEAPGEDEDAQGVPFVGKAGQMLTDIIEKGMKIKRSEVYIANVVKCRPPANRDPQPDEQQTCLPFLNGQIDAIRPRVIVALGKVAAQALSGQTAAITKMRGKWLEYRSIPMMPTFHPIYVLRSPEQARRPVWEDIQEVMRKIGIPLEGDK